MNPELVYLPGWEGAVLNASEWLREHLDLPYWKFMDEPFAEYFGCEIYREMMDPPFEQYPARVYAVFTEQAAVEFLLRWS